MIDIFGVGVCIACISYICCVYTTFITLSARPLFTSGDCDKRKHRNHTSPKSSADKSKQKSRSSGKQPYQEKPPKPKAQQQQQQQQQEQQQQQQQRWKYANRNNNEKMSSGSSKCACAAASSRLHSAEPAMACSRRKICIVASSFLDYEGSDERKNGFREVRSFDKYYGGRGKQGLNCR